MSPERVYALVSGSPRPDSQSAKVTRYVAAQVAAADPGASVTVVDLAVERPEMWHEGFWSDGPSPCPVWARLSALFARSDGLVFVTPEWNGIVPPPLTNLFLLASRGELAHKPALLVGVSATQGGAYPVASLRASAQKNTQVCYIPDQVIVRDARNVLEGPEPQSDQDATLRERIAYSARVLREYAAAFRQIRRSGVVDLETWPFGM
jgi:NAD(P)H-dependent FMN reductase